MAGPGSYQAARNLLMRVGPRLNGQKFRPASETPVAAAIRIAPHLDRDVLPIQGPPGAGKTYTGARMICSLAHSGKKSGVTASSHKVIRKLLDGVIEAANEIGTDVRCIQKVSESEADLPPFAVYY
jgi:hypothetical protein